MSDLDEQLLKIRATIRSMRRSIGDDDAYIQLAYKVVNDFETLDYVIKSSGQLPKEWLLTKDDRK
jgi:hypothetical protein